jgi:hypothetical protein
MFSFPFRFQRDGELQHLFTSLNLCGANDTGEKLYASKPIENIEKLNLKLA